MNRGEQDISSHFIIPDWPAAACIRACTSLRTGGVSKIPYDSNNLATHVGDEPRAVTENRKRLRSKLGLPAEPGWLNQVHGTRIVDAMAVTETTEADGSFFDSESHPDNVAVCVVMTADCLPALMCNRQGTKIAAVHAGWRGLSSGVLESGISAMNCDPADILVWLGPAIGPAYFEVGDEVRAGFIEQDHHAAVAFLPSPEGRWLADIYQLATLRLSAVGVRHIYGGGLCTYTDATRFYSFRRNKNTGRMASLIWIDNTTA